MTWSETVVRVGTHDVRLALARLPDEQRQPMAASIAWFTVLAITEAPHVQQDAWPTFVSTVIAPYVEFSVAHDEPEALGDAFWLEAMRAALMALVRANALDTLISEQLPTAYHLARAQAPGACAATRVS